MANPMIEERVSALEKQMEQLLQSKAAAPAASTWLQQWFGAFTDSPNFDSASERGAEYRGAQPTAVDNEECRVSPCFLHRSFFLVSSRDPMGYLTTGSEADTIMEVIRDRQ
jgi:hypothetical protein